MHFFVILSLVIHQCLAQYSHVPLYSKQHKCKPYSSNMTSVIVKDTRGNLGNKMFTFILIYMLRVKYGLDAYTTSVVKNHLAEIFENMEDYPTAETELCGFQRFYKEFWHHRQAKSKAFFEQEKQLRQKESRSVKFLEEAKEVEMISILNSGGHYFMKVDINETQRRYSSFPWETYFDDMHHLEKKDVKRGKAYIFFPNGMLMKAFDDTFGDDFNYYPDDVPGLVDFTVKSFTFRPFIRNASNRRLLEVSEDFKKRNPKKFKKRQDITFVGIHHRRGDHLQYQKEGGMKSLEPAYFLEAMEMYREKFKRVVFIYVTDDIQWGREKLEKRLKTNDLYIAGFLQDSHLQGRHYLHFISKFLTALLIFEF